MKILAKILTAPIWIPVGLFLLTVYGILFLIFVLIFCVFSKENLADIWAVMIEFLT
jgi:uncharacterized membrane-anchored protein YitT (DUF2179 family)